MKTNIKSDCIMKTGFLTLCLTIAAFSFVRAQEKDHRTEVVRNILSIGPSKATKVNGLCLTFSHSKARTINGLNIEFPGARFTEYFVYMLSRDIYPERFSTINGVTITFNPIYNKVNGLAIIIFMPEIYEFNGVSIGGFNAVKEMNGVQIGFINGASDGRLVQIGLMNTISSNPKPFKTLPLFNFRF
jgi:hypothetical protein